MLKGNIQASSEYSEGTLLEVGLAFYGLNMKLYQEYVPGGPWKHWGATAYQSERDGESVKSAAKSQDFQVPSDQLPWHMRNFSVKTHTQKKDL